MPLSCVSPKGNAFFPLRVEDFVRYSSLYVKDQDAPLVHRGKVTPDQLLHKGRSSEVFLRSVDAGPLQGSEVAAHWGKQTIGMVYQWAQKTTTYHG